ncbi:hypothetical protein C0991_001730 [Blastosporella zonata]|nr:hypothetical protein C0991_001730 [Blastosporella zonata]
MILNFAVKPDNFLIKLLNALTLPYDRLSCLLTSRFLLHLRRYLSAEVEGTQLRSSSEHDVASRLEFGNPEVTSELAHSNAASTIGTGGNFEEDYDGLGTDEPHPQLTNREAQVDNVAVASSSRMQSADEMV